MTTLAEMAAEPVFAAGGRAYTWGDIFAAARARGQWSEEPLPEGDAPEGAVKAAGRQFRIERRLLAADELRAWLAERRLTVGDWDAWLRRVVLRSNGAPGGAPAGEDVVWADGICSGAFDAMARALAERAAALAAAPSGPPAAGEGHLAAAERAYREFVARVSGSNEPARAVAANGIDWLRVECEYVAAGDEDVAREVLLRVREDGVPLAEVARQAGRESVAGFLYAGELEPELRTRVLSATPGETVGPVAAGGAFLVLSVRDKVAPSMDDPEIRERAQRWAVSAAVEREVAERVRWLPWEPDREHR